MDKSWKKLFEEKIRKRGREYARYYVSDYAADENGYSAYVSGTQKYRVTVSSDYAKMSCTCPYAADGKHCKHMAAVLYYTEYLEECKKEEERKAKEKAERQAMREVIKESEEKTKLNLQTTLLQNVQAISDWKKEINSLIKRYSNRDGHIGYWQADDFIFELLNYFKLLYFYLSVCADKKVIDASVWLYKKIHYVGVDDSSTGCTWYFEEEISALWEEIAEYSDNNKKLLKTALADCENGYMAIDKMLDKLSNV